jgi:GNAT superfamily N-acetyltransferase
MALEIRAEFPTGDQLWELYQTTDWNENYRLSPDELTRALQSSWYVLSAFDGECLVGFGRLVSDGVLHAMIYELIVLPEYQDRGIGGVILEMLVKHCRNVGIRDIQLFCAKGKRDYYEKRGFRARPVDSPGMQYVR